MVTKRADIWVCFNCGNLQGKHDQWFEGDICEVCYEKYRKKSEVTWHQQLEVLMDMVGKKPNGIQQDCIHTFKIIPKSGARFGIKLWQCETCGTVVQAV